MRGLIRALAGEHTVLLSSHILSEVQDVCDQILILHHGKIICDSALSALRRGERRLRAVIACGEGAVEIISLQAEGGKRMAAPDYFRGHPLEH